MHKKIRISIRIMLIPLWILIFIIYLPIWIVQMTWYYFEFSDYKDSYLLLFHKTLKTLRL